MKKKLCLVLALVLLVCMAFTACGKTETPNPTKAPEGGNTETPSDTFEYEKLTLQLGHTGNPEHHYQVTATAFAEAVSEATGGNVTIQVYPSEQLGSAPTMLESVYTGTQSMVLAPTAQIASYAPIFDILEMPYNLESWDVVKAFPESDAAKQLEQDAADAGLVVLGWVPNGFHLFTSNKAVNGPDDFSGLQVRIASSALMTDIWTTLKATPITIPMGETYTALSNGTVDAQSNPTSNILGHKLYEVQDHLAVTRHIFMFNPLVINAKLYNSMSPELQQLLKDTATQCALEDIERVSAAEDDQIKQLEELGMELTYPDAAEMKVAFAPLYDKYAEKNGEEWTDLMDKIHSIG